MSLYISLVITMLVFAFALFLLQCSFAERLRLERRLVMITKLRLEHGHEAFAESPLQLPLGDRLILPFLKTMGNVLKSGAPQALMSRLKQRVRAAGLDITAEQFAGWYVVAGGGALVFFTLLGWVRFQNALSVAAVGLAAGGLGAILPELVLRQRIQRRRAQIVRALPDVLDLLTVSVNAGLGFDSALMKVTEKMKGPLPLEMGQVLHEIKMGLARRDALKSLAERTGVEELRAFVSTIIQADQLGVSISKVLKLQSESLRQRRRQRAEEMALKAPVKMLFPLVVFIFPTLFIVLLGPAVLQIMASLGGM